MGREKKMDPVQGWVAWIVWLLGGHENHGERFFRPTDPQVDRRSRSRKAPRHFEELRRNLYSLMKTLEGSGDLTEDDKPQVPGDTFLCSGD